MNGLNLNYQQNQAQAQNQLLQKNPIKASFSIKTSSEDEDALIKLIENMNSNQENMRQTFLLFFNQILLSNRDIEQIIIGKHLKLQQDLIRVLLLGGKQYQGLIQLCGKCEDPDSPISHHVCATGLKFLQAEVYIKSFVQAGCKALTELKLASHICGTIEKQCKIPALRILDLYLSRNDMNKQLIIQVLDEEQAYDIYKRWKQVKTIQLRQQEQFEFNEDKTLFDSPRKNIKYNNGTISDSEDQGAESNFQSIIGSQVIPLKVNMPEQIIIETTQSQSQSETPSQDSMSINTQKLIKMSMVGKMQFFGKEKKQKKLHEANLKALMDKKVLWQQVDDSLKGNIKIYHLQKQFQILNLLYTQAKASILESKPTLKTKNQIFVLNAQQMNVKIGINLFFNYYNKFILTFLIRFSIKK